MVVTSGRWKGAADLRRGTLPANTNPDQSSRMSAVCEAGGGRS